MREEFTKNVIGLIAENPDCDYIMLGQEDVNYLLHLRYLFGADGDL